MKVQHQLKLQKYSKNRMSAGIAKFMNGIEMHAASCNSSTTIVFPKSNEKPNYLLHSMLRQSPTIFL